MDKRKTQQQHKQGLKRRTEQLLGAEPSPDIKPHQGEEQQEGTDLQKQEQRLRIKIASGPQMGQSISVRSGVIIGRNQGQLQVLDPKISGQHARIIQEPLSGNFILVDMDSFNGIRCGEAKTPQPQLPLSIGTEFFLGKTKFQVIENPKVSRTEQLAELLSHLPLLSPTSATNPVSPSPETPAPLLSPESTSTKLPQGGLRPFLPPIKLEFIKGIQAHREVLLGYGPRAFGYANQDVEILDPQIPVQAFELHPLEEDQVLFLTDYPHLVKVNYEPTSSQILQMGDWISLGSTLIRITSTIDFSPSDLDTAGSKTGE